MPGRFAVQRPYAPAVLLAAAILFCQLMPAGAEDLSVTVERPYAYDVVSGVVNFSGRATGAQGVQVSLDGGSWSNASGASNWSFLWNSSAVPDGQHTVQARAFSGSTYAASSQVQFTVNNTPPSFLEITLDLTPQQVNAGESFVASGQARFDSGVLVAGGPVQLTYANASANATTDSRGYYSASLAAPDAPGRTPVRALISASNLSGTAVAYLNVTLRAPPDLSVTPGNISFVPDQPYGGEPVTIGAIVHNTGGTNASARVRFSTDGHDSQDVLINVSAGGSWNPSVSWQLPSGNHTINVLIQDISPYDANSSNDNASRELHVLARPDLGVAAIVFSNSRPTEGMRITIQARLSNAGEKEATGTVTFYDGAPASGAAIGSQRLAVPANNTRMALQDWNATRGPHNITVVITDILPGDASSANNVLTRRLDVAVKSAPPAPAPGFEGAAAPAVFLILMLFAMRMRSSNQSKK